MLALNVGVIVALIVLTLVFGRIYCSVICPLGIMQDIFARLRPRKNKKVGHYSYSPEVRWLRYPVLVLFILAVIAGFGSFVALLAPYSSFGRIVVNLLRPLYEWGNNGLAAIAEHYDSYAFYSTDVWLRSLPTFFIAVATVVLLFVLAWVGGRTYCNTICPVGTFLSFISRFSFLKVRFDVEKCRNCSACTKACKAACIDFKNHSVDYYPDSPPALPVREGAVTNDSCNADARSEHSAPSLTGRAGGESALSRRSFLIGASLATTTALAQEAKLKVDGGLAEIEDKKAPERKTPLVPPGALSAKNFAQHCTGCQLCVAQCPNQVLRPSTGLMTLMQPEMSYERGYCRPECNLCSEVCPAGAIRPITVEEKSSVQIGHAVWIKDNCLAANDGVECDNCARHCPVGAIQMVPLNPDDELGAYVPAVNEATCIGCGACENLCPARPFSAIYVEGHEVHKEI